MNSKKFTNSCESNEISKHQYVKDSRLKFYQILQSKTHGNLTKTQCIAERPCCPTQNCVSNTEHNNSSSTIAQKIIPRINSVKSCHLQNTRTKNIPVHISSNTKPENDINSVIDYGNNQRRIEQLFMLIEGQSKQLKLLEQQIHTLLSKMSGYQDNSHQASSQVINNSIKPIDSIKCYEKHLKNEAELSPLNKVSIGVMTSFEFTIRSNLDVKVVSMENPQFPDEIRGGDESHTETMNLVKSPLEKILERSEGRFSEQSDRHVADSHKVQCHSIDKINRCCDESIKASTKVGRTFYNNILHHVNEILHDSAGIHSSSSSYEAKQQVKLVETALSNSATVITSNFNDKIYAMDPILYPRVHCQTSILQNSNSTMDTNASAHMKKLALKYLSDKFYETDNLTETQKSINGLEAADKFDGVLRNNLPISTIDNTSDEFVTTATNLKFVESNILDIPILKSQPKLL